MLKKPKSKQKSVAEKVAELIVHPNQSGSESESENEATAPKVIEFDEDEYQLPEEQTTEFRKRNVKLLSEQSSKYKGKIASRKEFEEEEEDGDEEDDDMEYEESDEEDDDADVDEDEEDAGDEDASDSEDDSAALKAFSKALKKTQTVKQQRKRSDQEDDDEDSNDSNEDDDEDDYENGENVDSSAEDDESDAEENGDDNDDDETEVISKVNHEAEMQKGICVQNQLRLWERLLELRINTQKFLSKANQLPAANELNELASKSDEHKALLQETSRHTQNLLHNLVALQNSLFTQYTEVATNMKDTLKRPSPFKELQSGEPQLKRINLHLQERFERFRPYRDTVLLKWDDRTKLLTPGAGTKKKSMDEDYDIIKKINNALMNKSLMVKKSQQLKSTQLPKKSDSDVENQEDVIINCNIYDDSDFYHQQLRELIEYKANTSSNMSEVTKQYLELQKLRQKMKKKVDTRASKGRKLRYLVHNKLINFMAPHDNSTWTDESKEELCKSLFV